MPDRQLLPAFLSMLQHVKPQEVANVLWAVANMD
jgi:hypothetical protein